jgi:deazaflavin-dependent oxidoreductase (nitroreductase family)
VKGLTRPIRAVPRELTLDAGGILGIRESLGFTPLVERFLNGLHLLSHAFLARDTVAGTESIPLRAKRQRPKCRFRGIPPVANRLERDIRWDGFGAVQHCLGRAHPATISMVEQPTPWGLSMAQRQCTSSGAPHARVGLPQGQEGNEMQVTGQPEQAANLPPRWFIRLFWMVQRAVYVVTGGRIGLQTATADHQGMLRLRTVGRRSGRERVAILGYFEDGPDLVTMAMNGWADPEPAWWLNLQAQPDVTVDLPGGSRAVHARAADPEERPRLWARWAGYDKGLDAYAARRSRETAVVIMSPRVE